jgi:RNA-directed DNA polymerase
MADDMAAQSAGGSAGVNGPEGGLDWDAVDWRSVEKNVRRLRRRIFAAEQDGDLAKVRDLQKLLLGSWSNTLLAVRQVTQRNTGRATAGVDGEVALTAQARARVAGKVHATRGNWTPLPVKRVYIPKARDKRKRRPLGIPVIMDRCHQARAKNALEPQWEARMEPRSYGFRPGRGCHDAIGALYTTLKGAQAKRVWILDADLSNAFDQIDHSQLLASLGSFPAREQIRAWLKAGVIEAGRGFAPTDEGTPQGGVISPLLLNVALHGLEAAAGVRYYTSGTRAGDVKKDSPVLVRFADDFVVCCHSKEQAIQSKARIAAWLKPRGLALNEEKTHIVSLETGFDFLSFNIRRYRSQRGGKLLIKPAKPALRQIRGRLAADMRSLRGSNAMAVIARLNPQVRGIAAYYRTVVSKKVFHSLDDHMWKLTYKWAKHSHPNKSRKWVSNRYFGKFNKLRDDRWVFGDRDSGVYLIKFSWSPIERHLMVKGAASPDDPALAAYWRQRRRRNPAPDGYTHRLVTSQDGHCPLCEDLLLDADHPPQTPADWEQWTRVMRKAILADAVTHGRREQPNDRIRLVHASCARGHSARHRRNPALLQP